MITFLLNNNKIISALSNLLVCSNNVRLSLFYFDLFGLIVKIEIIQDYGEFVRAF